MGIIHRPRHTVSDWLAKGPIGPYVDAFKQYLTERGYAANTVASYVVGITHFARWARTKRLRLDRIDEVSIAEFLDNHLLNCQCVAPVRHDRGDHSAALGHLLVVLRSLGAIPPATLSATAVMRNCAVTTSTWTMRAAWRQSPAAWRCASLGGC